LVAISLQWQGLCPRATPMILKLEVQQEPCRCNKADATVVTWVGLTMKLIDDYGDFS
jgi:hypothetical protein